MQANATLDHPVRFTETQRNALLRLLTDEDPSIYRTIREKILSCGPSVIEWLRPQTLSSEPCLRRRTLEIIDFFERQAADMQFLAFCLNTGKVFDLEHASLLLARTANPQASLAGYGALLDLFAAELAERLGPGLSGREILEAFNRYFLLHLHFTPSLLPRLNPRYVYLDYVLDRRVGDPASLSLLYYLIARRLRLPLTIVGFPSYYVCRYQTSVCEMYVDAFHGGRISSKAERARYLNASAIWGDGGSGPASPRRFLLHSCEALQLLYDTLGPREEALRLKRYVVALRH